MEIELEKIGLMKEQLDDAMDLIIEACGDITAVSPGEYYPRIENMSQDKLESLWYKISSAWEIAYKTVNGPLTIDEAPETLVLSGEMLEIDMSMPEDK
jgi:hypothetical protein